MNPHNEIRALLTLAAARALDGAEQARVEAHIRDCADCAAELASMQRIAAALGGLPAPQPSLGLAARTRLRVAAEMAARAKRRQYHILITLLVCFGWIITLLTLLAGRYFAEDLAYLFNLSFAQFAVAFIGYTLLASVASAVFAGLIGPRVQAARRMS
ncbi:MAG TPA: zf-HC2 domain-containing protein [Candidatus Angelobacter sp.]|jgi:anti-sigma factor RsiW|nr:zf-HC2 domain-containing protein [Candidatus Angelobacter sp.]